MRSNEITNRIEDTKYLSETDQKMPVIFVGHGSPMNAIEENDFTKTLQKVGRELPKPKTILCISAHWTTRGSFVNISPKPEMIYDMYGFPRELYEVQYPAVGSPDTAKEVQRLISFVQSDSQRGFDHGNWSIMKHLFPNADIPLLQMSIDYYKPMSYHYELAKQLKPLRRRDVLIVGSGNITHNLQIVDLNSQNAEPRDWALEFDGAVKRYIDEGNHKGLIDYEKVGDSARLAVPEPSHYFPLIYTIALQENGEQGSYFYDKFHYGTLSMRCVKFG